MQWKPKTVLPPDCGWYYVYNRDGSLSSRYFDDSHNCWYYVTAWDGFTPNDSFVEWLYIPELHRKNKDSTNSDLLNEAERTALDSLATAWNSFLELGSAHPDETAEFRHAIHTAQRIIMARPVMKEMNQ